MSRPPIKAASAERRHLYDFKRTNDHAPPPADVLDTSDATATADQILNGATAYVSGAKITGTHVCAAGTVVTPVANSDGTITVDGIAKMPTSFMFVLGVESGFYAQNNGGGSGGIPDMTMIFLYANGAMSCRQFGSAGGEITQYNTQYDYDVSVGDDTLKCIPSSTNTNGSHITAFRTVLSAWGLII